MGGKLRGWWDCLGGSIGSREGFRIYFEKRVSKGDLGRGFWMGRWLGWRVCGS